MDVDAESAAVRERVSAFLARFCEAHFPKKESRAEVKVDQIAAAKVLGVSQGYVSEVLRRVKAPGLQLVLRLHQLTGASIQEITGADPPADSPPYPVPPPRSATARARAQALLRDDGTTGEVRPAPNRRRRAI